MCSGACLPYIIIIIIIRDRSIFSSGDANEGVLIKWSARSLAVCGVMAQRLFSVSRPSGGSRKSWLSSFRNGKIHFSNSLKSCLLVQRGVVLCDPEYRKLGHCWEEISLSFRSGHGVGVVVGVARGRHRTGWWPFIRLNCRLQFVALVRPLMN